VTLIGYFPKLVASRPDWLKAPQVREIASVSTCISKGPPDWIDQWRHNSFGLFDTVALAESVVPPAQAVDFEVFAYSLLGEAFAEGKPTEGIGLTAQPEQLAEDFSVVGYDAVSKSISDFFECSPLSCNGVAQHLTTNDLCLFPTFDEAQQGAREFSFGQWEPGTYYVIEVRRRCPTGRCS